MKADLRDAARYLRTLYAVELSHALGNKAEVERLLASVDPPDLLSLAAALDGLSASLPNPGAEPSSPPAPLHSAGEHGASPTSPDSSAPVNLAEEGRRRRHERGTARLIADIKRTARSWS